jgi:hypothetical protein
MADQINRIGGGGYVQQEELLQEELEQSQGPEESGSSQAASQVANGQQANASGQPAGPKAGEQAEEKPAAANAPLEEHHHHHHLQQQRRAAQTTPRRPTRPGSKKDEHDGIDHLEEVPDEVEAALFRETDRADEQETTAGQEGDSRLAASEEETAASSREATDGSASGTGKSSSAKNLGSGTAATSGSPGSAAKTEGPGRESVKTTPAATGQAPGSTGSGASPRANKAQAHGRPAPDSQKLTLDSAASAFNRDRLKFAATQGNPRASHGPTLGRPVLAPVDTNVPSLQKLKNGTYVPWGPNRTSSLNVAQGPVSLAPDSMKLNAESVASQLGRARVNGNVGNRRASYGPMVANARVPSNAPLPGKSYSGDVQLRQLQARLYRPR